MATTSPIHTGFYDAMGNEITKEAFFALRAAKLRDSIGTYAARRFALNNGVPLRLFCLACQLQAVSNARFPLDFT